MSLSPDATGRGPNLREMSPFAQATSLWFRQMARALKTFRLYRGESNAVSDLLRDAVAGSLERILAEFGTLNLRFTPTEILLEDEAVVKVPPGLLEGPRDPVEAIPFLVYRDGIRRMQILKDATRPEIEALLDALTLASAGPDVQDDLVTLLWQGTLTRILFETVPLEQTIYLSVRRPAEQGTTGVRGQTYVLNPGGAEIRAETGQAAGPQGLHRDTFDDWPLPESWPEARESWSHMRVPMEAALELFLERCRAEQQEPWFEPVAPLARRLLEFDASERMRFALVHAAISWVAGSLQKCRWDEAQQALALLRELDPDGRFGEHDLASAVAGLDHQVVTDSLDAAGPEDPSRFAAIVVAIGRPALDLATNVMARSDKMRVRAAACTALTYLCGDDPALLAPYLEDSRWPIVRNAVFVLGLIGGEAVVPLLRRVAHHPEPRVLRQLVQSVGNVPREQRLDIAIAQLGSRDPQVLAAALNMITRERSAKVARAILDRIEAPDFESRREDNQRALFAALADVADDSVVGPLEALLNKGGWFARRTLERTAVARTLRHIGTEKSQAVLEAGLRSRVEAVRAACLEAMSTRMVA
jgi:hypothetical protein